MIFDEAPAKSAAVHANETYIALIVIYDRQWGMLTYQSLYVFGNRVMKQVEVLAGSGYIVKLVGFDRAYNITYSGYTQNVKVLPGMNTSVDVYMNYMGFFEIPGGTFSMGSETGEDDERPVHTVTVNSFLMHSTEVTQFQYKHFIEFTELIRPDRIQLFLDLFSDDPLHPCHTMGWIYIAEMCNRMSINDGLDPCYSDDYYLCDITKNGYRIPTEAEWEYACRAQSETNYSSGDSVEDLDKTGWYDDNTDTIHVSGMKEPNAWGLYDMHGNVWEFCNDVYLPTYYADSPSDNPTGPHLSNPIFENIVIRGGSYSSPADSCRSSSRCFTSRGSVPLPTGARIVRTLN